MRSDSDIKRDVEDELRWDPDIDATDIAVTVKNEPAGEPSDAAEQVSANRSSTPDTSESAPPKERGDEPAGPSADDPAELRDRLLRALAEQQNFQRRLERERDDAVRFAACHPFLQPAGVGRALCRPAARTARRKCAGRVERQPRSRPGGARGSTADEHIERSYRPARRSGGRCRYRPCRGSGRSSRAAWASRQNASHPA
jgi:hypothetical protein